MQQAHIELADRRIAVWPDGQKITTRGDPAVLGTCFADAELYHARLTDAILAAAYDPDRKRRYFRASGGTKIYHLERWGVPEVDLACARARELFCRAVKAEQAVTDLSWANIYQRGDYAMAHSHERADASIVYFVDLGDSDPRDPLAGRFAFVDPRIQRCAGAESPRVIAPLLPKIVVGDMLVFPAAMVHSVNPYAGRRPRITLAWNMAKEAKAGDPLPF